jgi:VCBS repeat-containing protein
VQAGEQVLFGSVEAAGATHGDLGVSEDGAHLTYSVDADNAAIAKAKAGAVFTDEYEYSLQDGLALGESGEMAQSATGALSVELHNQNRDGSLSFSDLNERTDYIEVQGEAQSYISAGGGADTIIGGAGNMSASGGAGDDSISGGQGYDTMYGGSGNDSLDGGVGNDALYGGSGNDRLYGGDGSDTLDGGAGNDMLYGGSGLNTIRGGSGADTFAWRNVSDLDGGTDVISDFSAGGGDRLSFSDLFGTDTQMALAGDNISGLSLNTTENTLSFTLSQGECSRTVELRFDSADNAYQQLSAEYTAAQAENSSEAQALLTQFLIQVSS